MAFEDVSDGSDVFVITSDDFEIPRSKRRVQYQPNGFLGPVISKSQEPLNFSEIKHSAYVPAKFSSLYLI